jgi:ABC-type enterochelin transport system substrate-binding protein
MKPDQLYQELKNLAEKLSIHVEEHNFRESGIHVTSGLCTVRGQQRYIMDKHKSVAKKIQMLAGALARCDLESIYIVPAVREVLDRYADEEPEGDESSG